MYRSARRHLARPGGFRVRVKFFTGTSCNSVGRGGTCELRFIDMWAESIQECYESGVAQFFCPMDEDITLIPMSPNLLCKVCSIEAFEDQDPRAAVLTGRLHFGPNQRGGEADESLLWGYRLTFVDACGAELAEFGKVPKRSYPPAVCCDPWRYSFDLESVAVPAGATAIQISPYKENWHLLGGASVGFVDLHVSTSTTMSQTTSLTNTTASTTTTSNSTVSATTTTSSLSSTSFTSTRSTTSLTTLSSTSISTVTAFTTTMTGTLTASGARWPDFRIVWALLVVLL
ncbi:unnamed protein product [Symbiodinium natans]|uniref:Uncharacterized protein n=1 Tax=Symbiodinium natans TaxID=878477 RepID=A0A812MV32_9DINO|nr:unnamed protein product [Symbiodinium natans]